MTLAIVYSRTSVGIQAPLVTVEAHISPGLPALSIVGLPEAAVKESKDRVRSAIINSGLEFPTRRITINLAPADLPKEGGRFDLPIAIGILAASNQIPADALAAFEFSGELALSGALRSIQAALPIALGTRKTNRTLILPTKNAREATLPGDNSVLPAKHLLEVCDHLTGKKLIPPYSSQHTIQDIVCKSDVDLHDVKGQPQAKRALEITAAGGHSLLMVGPPGTGKTMLATRLPGLLPPLSIEEALEISAIRSISHTKLSFKNWGMRPFRAPHHTASSAALVGGGSNPRPGEISLAHHGVLFLDELPEFDRKVLEVLREPLESGNIVISRAMRQAEFPARFQLIAAMNPCPCGYLGAIPAKCSCSGEQIKKYRARLSGPLLDRIDMHIEVPLLPTAMLTQIQNREAESSHTVRQRIMQAYAVQIARSNKTNAKLSNKELESVCQLEPRGQALMKTAMDKLGLSARSYHRILRVARTIADLQDSKSVQASHLSEALSYRKMDRTEHALA